MRAIIGSLLLLCSLCGYAVETTTITADPSSKKFVVSLPSNPTTGYQWTVTTYDKSILNMTGSQYIPPQKKLIGAGGNMTFTFALIKGKSYPQSTKMLFTYARAWDPKSGMLKNVVVNFKAN